MQDHHNSHGMPPYYGGYDYSPRPHGDTEHAHVVEPWENCCDEDPQDCICVTSADVELWNKVSAISGISGIENLSALSSFTEIATSADKWNSTYGTVLENSANWSSAYSALDDIYDDISALDDAIKAKHAIYVNTSDFYGNGTKDDPLGIISGADYRKTFQKLVALASSAFDGMDINKRNWIDKIDYNDLMNRILHIDEVNNAQTSAININWEHIEEIIRRLNNYVRKEDYHELKAGKGVTIDSKYKINVKDYDKITQSAAAGKEAFNYVNNTSANYVKYVNEKITQDNIDTLTAKNTIYYSFTD